MLRGSLQSNTYKWMAAAMLISIAALVIGISGEAHAQSSVLVKADEASVVPLVKNPATVVVGNPGIADVSVQNGNLLVVMGKNYGTTNVIALDGTGEQIAEFEVSVTTGGRHEVSLHRGSIARITYNCAPTCERELNVGDGVPEFEQIFKQITNKTLISNPDTESPSENN